MLNNWSTIIDSVLQGWGYCIWGWWKNNLDFGFLSSTPCHLAIWHNNFNLSFLGWHDCSKPILHSVEWRQRTWAFSSIKKFLNFKFLKWQKRRKRLAIFPVKNFSWASQYSLLGDRTQGSPRKMATTQQAICELNCWKHYHRCIKWSAREGPKYWCNSKSWLFLQSWIKKD